MTMAPAERENLERSPALVAALLASAITPHAHRVLLRAARTSSYQERGMMEKLILFVKRKPGLTHEQFRAHYESTHAPLAKRTLSKWLVHYERNFLSPLPG
jgi:hypothetical protein